MCSPYATPATVAMALKAYGSAYRQCYSWLGPSQPGVNETDPTDPSAPVPDPGGAPPGQHGPVTDAARLTAARPAADVTGPQAHRASTKTRPAEPKPKPGSSSSGPTGSGASSTGAAGSGSLSSSATGSGASSTVAAGSGSLSTGATGSGATGQAQRLLNYLLAP
jgi:hypothetical protein